MTAYMIAQVEVTDTATFEEYRKQVPATIAAYDGKYLVRGGALETVEGSWKAKRLVVLEFPTMARAKQWYDSKEYAPLKAMRMKAARTDVTFVEGL
jgi:uncharacterized protein (DUF1330 family)